MKKLLFALCMGISTIAFSQDSETTDFTNSDRKHEIRIDALEALVVTTIELNYEYVISKYSGVGAAISVGFDNEDELDNYQTFAFTPYYRQYFFNKKDYGARGLFAEGLLQIGLGEESFKEFDSNGNSSIINDSWTSFGIGFALGQKWVSKNGFVLEISIGGGRYLGNADNSPDGFARGGVLVGYRF